VFQSLSIIGIVGLFGAIPVMLIYVHDRDNGTLEYLLSMGMNQMDIFWGYLTASLIIGGALLLVGAVGVVGVAVYLGMLSSPVLTTLTLSVIIGVSVVCLVTVLMMSYAALQRQPVGMNQPLGIAVGALLMLGFMFIPNAFPANSSTVQLLIAGLIVAMSMFFVYMAPKLIRREKMLP
jgi:putative exporter of polyketide antibiotics